LEGQESVVKSWGLLAFQIREVLNNGIVNGFTCKKSREPFTQTQLLYFGYRVSENAGIMTRSFIFSDIRKSWYKMQAWLNSGILFCV
jgi:hypothetical protein